MAEMMDFFEALEQRADVIGEKYINTDLVDDNLIIGFGIGIDATIEALREMMVGEPKLARMTYNVNPDGEEWTSVWCFDGEQISLDGRQGTDGEQVYVIVFRSGGRLLAPEEPPLDEEK